MEIDSVLAAFLDIKPVEGGGVDGPTIPLADPVGSFLRKAVAGESPDPTWLEPIGAAPRVELSKTFLARSDARLDVVKDKLRVLFGDHAEELQEAIELAESMRAAVREEILA